MARLLRRAGVIADMSAVDELLRRLSPDDALGRISLASRKEQLLAELESTGDAADHLASTALYFGGKPVVGSVGIQADFAAKMIEDYRDSVVKMWAAGATDLAARGPIAEHGLGKLHVTALLHGSMGFLIEEIEPKATPLFPTPLKQAAEAVDELIIGLARKTDEEFQEQLEQVAPRVFIAVQRLVKNLHQAEATVRIVDSERDEALSKVELDKAYVRLEESNINEELFTEDGLLIGILPYGERFEFQRTGGLLITGKVAPTLSEAYLKKLEEDRAFGKWWRATISRREITRFGRRTEKYLLVDLVEIVQPA